MALKVLPEDFASDRERLARLQLETRTLAALRHPRIADTHRVEEGLSTRASLVRTRGCVPT